ncbi:MAG: hypothetical protein IJ507_02480 [Clostridia bacterium]|nr:hypothetical protein [Clostridia bacterium]
MKKLLSLVLVLCMVLCAVPASAVTLGAPFTFDTTTFQLYFNTFYTSTGYGSDTPVWTNGSDLITVTGDALLPVQIHLTNGKVAYFTTSMEGDLNSLQNAATQLGVTLPLIAMSSLMAETGDASALQSKAATFNDDFTQLLSCMLNASDLNQTQMEEGVTSSANIFGYPAILGYRVDFSNASAPMVYLTFMMGPVGTTY